MIEGAKKDVNQMVGKITPETKPEVITIVAPQGQIMQTQGLVLNSIQKIIKYMLKIMT